MTSPFDRDFRLRLHAIKERVTPYLKGRMAVAESPTGLELSPEPDSPRGYVPGDDVRAIDWNLYARLDRLFLKSATREEEIPLAILLDASRSMADPFPDKSILAWRLAAALADIHLALGLRVWLLPWGDGIREVLGPFQGEHESEALMTLLEKVTPGGGSDLKRTLGDLLPLAGGGRVLPLIISDFLFPLAWRSEAALLSVRHGGLRGVQVLDRRETSFRRRGSLILRDPEAERETAFVSSYGAMRSLDGLLREHHRGVEELFLQAGRLFVRALADEKPETALTAYFALADAPDHALL